MEQSFEQHRRALIREAIEHWDERGDIDGIEKDPVVKLLFSALAYQSHSISREISAFKEKTVKEFRNKMIPYHLIKPFPAFSVLETKISKNSDNNSEQLNTFVVDEKSVFEFGKNKILFAPFLKTKIINADISDKRIDKNNFSINLELSSTEIIEDFSGMSFYFENTEMMPDIEISMNNQLLPLIRPDDYENLPLTDWFGQHYLLREENQLQAGNFDYWQEYYIKNHIHLFYVNEYNTNKIRNLSNLPVFKIHFKCKDDFEHFRNSEIKINCMPIINVQKESVTLTNNMPVRKLSTEKNIFLNLLVNENSENDDDCFFIRHFGIERYNQEELLFQLNDLFNRFSSDYYAFKDFEELKKGEKIENLYKAFKDILPVTMKNSKSNYSGVYAILKLNKNLKYQFSDIEVDYLTTNCELANGIKEGENPNVTSGFLDKNNTTLLKETTGGRNEEIKEDNLNHLARYNLLTKDKLITSSDIKAFCYRELKNKIRSVAVNNTGDSIDIQLRLKEEYTSDKQEISYLETLIKQKIKVRSLFSIPVNVIIDN